MAFQSIKISKFFGGTGPQPSTHPSQRLFISALASGMIRLLLKKNNTILYSYTVEQNFCFNIVLSKKPLITDYTH